MADDKDVRLINWNLDEWNNTIVLRGVIDTDSLQYLRIDTYQREFLPTRSRTQLIRGIKNGARLPDMELGMRGQRFTTSLDNKTILLHDPVFIIDGRQRRDSVLDMLCDYPNVHLGAMIHFDTTEPWERHRFQVLNADRIKVAPGIILKNLRNDFPVIGMIYGLCHNDKAFPLYNKVTWAQQAHRGELLKCMTLANVALRLHTHLITQRASGPDDIANRLARLAESIGLATLRENIKTFWDVIDQCWGLSQVHYRAHASYIKMGFLQELAIMFSDHKAFWVQPGDKKLEVPRLLRLKLAKFAVSDPTVVSLAGTGGGQATKMLGMMLIEHMNSGKRTGRLVPRRVLPPIVDLDEANEAVEEA